VRRGMDFARWVAWTSYECPPRIERNAVIPSEVEKFRGLTGAVPRDPSTLLRFAQDDGLGQRERRRFL